MILVYSECATIIMADFGTVTSPQKKNHWTSLVVVQWLRLHASNAGAQVLSLVLIREDTTKKKEIPSPLAVTSHFPHSHLSLALDVL